MILVLSNMLVWGFAGLNGWLLAAGHGGPLNAVALAVCVGSGIYGLVVMAK